MLTIDAFTCKNTFTADWGVSYELSTKRAFLKPGASPRRERLDGPLSIHHAAESLEGEEAEHAHFPKKSAKFSFSLQIKLVCFSSGSLALYREDISRS